MRITDLLSRPISEIFVQCEPFLGAKNLSIGGQRKVDAGQILLTYHCNHCDNNFTFQSVGDLFTIRVGERLLSIDSVLECPSCKAKLPIWFLVESENNLSNTTYGKYRILKITEKFGSRISLANTDYGDFTNLLNQAEIAYRNQLGAAAIIYLRKVFEGVTHQIGNAAGILLNKPNGKLRPFKDILQEVDATEKIIPAEFSQNGYTLFEELSNIIHGNSDNDEELGLKKYKPLKRLITGILDNIKNKNEMTTAIETLGWNGGEDDE